MYRNLLRNPGLLLTGIWLILIGMRQFIEVTVTDTAIALIALGAGVLLLRKYRAIKMRTTLGFVLLGVWLIATAIFELADVSFTDSDSLLQFLGLIVGFFIALNNDVRRRRKLALLFLSIWLLLNGVVVLADFQFSAQDDLLAVFGFITGVLVVLDR